MWSDHSTFGPLASITVTSHTIVYCLTVGSSEAVNLALLMRSSTCQRLSCKSESGMYRYDVRPCSIGVPVLQGSTPGLYWGCLLPVMREVQGFDQHGQHSRRGGEWCRGQARDQKVSKGLLRQPEFTTWLLIKPTPKGVVLSFPFFSEQRVGRKLCSISRKAVWQIHTLMQMPV